MRHISRIGIPVFTIGALLFTVGLMGSCGEAKDNFDSQKVCHDYCDKKYDCENFDPSSEESSACVAACRDSIEDNCGNDHQGAANDRIGECVDQACADFWTCMTFEAAPECFGFVEQ